MNNLVEIVFQNELTKNGLDELRSKYPSDLVVDMSSDEEFKRARKTRTEMKKLVEAINRRRIDVSSEIKTHGDSLIRQVEDIYSVVVKPFEIEDTRRKEIAAEEKRKRDELLERQRADLRNISGAVSDCIGKPSGYIQDTIESIDLIDESCFDKELIHEVIEAKQNTLKLLSSALSQTIANEAAAEATKAAEAKMAEMQAQMEAMQRQMETQQAPEPPKADPDAIASPETVKAVQSQPAVEQLGLYDELLIWAEDISLDNGAYNELIEILKSHCIKV